MAGGFRYYEAHQIFLEELPHILRALRLKEVDKAKEQIWIISLVMASSETWKKAMRELRNVETQLGRKLLSAMDRISDPRVKRRLKEIQEQMKRKKEQKK